MCVICVCVRKETRKGETIRGRKKKKKEGAETDWFVSFVERTAQEMILR